MVPVRQGVIHMSRRSPTEATVQVGSAAESAVRQVWVLGGAAVNRALHGDTVAVRLLPRRACTAGPAIRAWVAPQRGASLRHRTPYAQDADSGM